MEKITMLTIPHIEPVGLIAKNGSDLATVFSNHYIVQAVNAIADQNDAEALHFLGSVAGQALLHLFSQNIKLNQLDSVLAQIRSHVIQTVGS